MIVGNVPRREKGNGAKSRGLGSVYILNTASNDTWKEG